MEFNVYVESNYSLTQNFRTFMLSLPTGANIYLDGPRWAEHHYRLIDRTRLFSRADEPLKDGHFKFFTEIKTKKLVQLVKAAEKNGIVKGLLTPSLLGNKVLSICMECQTITQGEQITCSAGHACVICFSSSFDVWKLGRELKFRLMPINEEEKQTLCFFSSADEFWKDIEKGKDSIFGDFVR